MMFGIKSSLIMAALLDVWLDTGPATRQKAVPEQIGDGLDAHAWTG